MSSQQTLFDVANHSNLGKFLEAEFETVHDWYRQRNIADIRKIPNGWTFISEKEYRKLQGKLHGSHIARTGDGRCMQRVKSDLDFVGSGARFGICFDAKATAGERLPLANIEPHQLMKMRQRARCGIIAGAMVFLGKPFRLFFVPSKYLDHRESILLRQTGRRAAQGTASLSLPDLEAHGVEIFRNKTNNLWDWLPILVK